MDDFLFLMFVCDSGDLQFVFFMLLDLNYLNSILLLLVLVPEGSHIHLWFRKSLSRGNVTYVILKFLKSTLEKF